MSELFNVIVLLLMLTLLVFFVYRIRLKRVRLERIRTYVIPAGVMAEVRRVYPHLTPEQVELVITGLRDYFEICHRSGRKFVSMPSQVVDVAWHGFILDTRAYQQFCKFALGRFLHHVPAEAMAAPTLAQDGIKRAWKLACKRENISPGNPSRLPLLFALDSMLDISDGFRYDLKCQPGSGNYCASHIGCGSSCGSSCGGDSGGCGGGD